jgi:hypothetical protein
MLRHKEVAFFSYVKRMNMIDDDVLPSQEFTSVYEYHIPPPSVESECFP